MPLYVRREASKLWRKIWSEVSIEISLLADEVHGSRFWKPFVEKPVDGDNHSIMIYYPSSAGGGMKELFRKVGNRSSEFRPEVRRVRREGSYIYEEFLPTGGTDVKVYTVGPEYAHAEARKSPVVDGVVMRNPDGKEVRYPVLLTPTEKQIAREVCMAFSQSDLLWLCVSSHMVLCLRL